jgi:hypothetical protein
MSYFTLPGSCTASRRLLTPSRSLDSSDFGLRLCCRFLRDFLFAGLQAAAMEAQRQRVGWGPSLEEFATIQRLDVCKLRGGNHFIFLQPAGGYLYE